MLIFKYMVACPFHLDSYILCLLLTSHIDIVKKKKNVKSVPSGLNRFEVLIQ